MGTMVKLEKLKENKVGSPRKKADSVPSTPRGQKQIDALTNVLLQDKPKTEAGKPSAEDRVTAEEIAEEIVKECNKRFGASTPEWKRRFLTIHQALRNPKNKGLREGILSGDPTIEFLCTCDPSELADAEQKEKHKAIKEKSMKKRTLTADIAADFSTQAAKEAGKEGNAPKVIGKSNVAKGEVLEFNGGFKMPAKKPRAKASTGGEGEEGASGEPGSDTVTDDDDPVLRREAGKIFKRKKQESGQDGHSASDARSSGADDGNPASVAPRSVPVTPRAVTPRGAGREGASRPDPPMFHDDSNATHTSEMSEPRSPSPTRKLWRLQQKKDWANHVQWSGTVQPEAQGMKFQPFDASIKYLGGLLDIKLFLSKGIPEGSAIPNHPEHKKVISQSGRMSLAGVRESLTSAIKSKKREGLAFGLLTASDADSTAAATLGTVSQYHADYKSEGRALYACWPEAAPPGFSLKDIYLIPASTEIAREILQSFELHVEKSEETFIVAAIDQRIIEPSRQGAFLSLLPSPPHTLTHTHARTHARTHEHTTNKCACVPTHGQRPGSPPLPLCPRGSILSLSLDGKPSFAHIARPPFLLHLSSFFPIHSPIRLSLQPRSTATTWSAT